ncbi:MAG: caspase family protein [Thaumarchaeota archaeon]|nr:caspase family protein [Nitrososphaerota archaeon]
MGKYYDDSWALLIGIGKFHSKKIGTLNNPVHDIENMEKTLVTHCGFKASNIIKIIDSDATMLNIKYKIEDLSNKISPNTRFLVYYSGHGETRTTPGRTAKKTGYLIPYDAKKAGKSLNFNSLMEFDELIELVHNRTKFKQNLFIFDCCFSGMAKMDIGESEFERPLCINDLKNAASNNKSVHVITAGGENEKILDSGANPDISILNHSIQNSIEKVNPNNFPVGFVTARNLAKEVNLMVGRTSVFLDKTQTPRFSVSTFDGEGEFVFKEFTRPVIHQKHRTKVPKRKVLTAAINSVIFCFFIITLYNHCFFIQSAFTINPYCR